MQVRDLVRRKEDLFANPLLNFGIVKEKMISGVDPAPCVDMFNPLSEYKGSAITAESYLELVLAIGQPIIWDGKMGTVFNIEIDKKGILVSIFGEWRSIQKVDIRSIKPLEKMSLFNPKKGVAGLRVSKSFLDVCHQLDQDMNTQRIKDKFLT